MRRGAALCRALCCGGLLWAGLARGEPAEPPADAGGSWTNLAGHALKAEPVAIRGQKITFKQAGTGRTVEFPLSVFPAGEQERLRVALKDTKIPEGLQSAYEFSARILKRSRLLREGGELSDEEYQKALAATVAAFRAQAAPLVEQQKLSPERLEIIVRELAAGK